MTFIATFIVTFIVTFIAIAVVVMLRSGLWSPTSGGIIVFLVSISFLFGIAKCLGTVGGQRIFWLAYVLIGVAYLMLPALPIRQMERPEEQFPTHRAAYWLQRVVLQTDAEHSGDFGHFNRTWHYLCAIIFAYFGGYLAKYFYERDKCPNENGSDSV